MLILANLPLHIQNNQVVSKISFPIEVLHNALQAQKGLQVVVRSQFLLNFLIKRFSFVI